MCTLLRWWIPYICLAGVLVPRCPAVQVFVRDEKKYAVLFQSVVLPCHYTSVSTQVPVVQWVYKSYCRDRTRDAFSYPDTLNSGGLGGGGGGGGAYGGGGYETGTSSSNLDCADTSRTVRTVASISGVSVTLSEHYKNRDISIINKADLRIGELQWGDSGIYICKVVISDDLEGKSEAPVELLVLGFSSVPEDLLPDFDLKIMPEWVFVSAVALGSVLFLLLVGVCWCQCCPHSCCCYVSCCCCPDTCCCPKHLYEAGKGIKTSSSTPQMALYPPYWVNGPPTVVPIAPPSLVDNKMSITPSNSSLVAGVPMHMPMRGMMLPYRVPSSSASQQEHDSLRVLQYVEKQLANFNPARNHETCSVSELSSLHEVDSGFRQSYRQVQKKALPAIPDLQPEPQRHRDNAEPQRYRADPPPSPRRYRDDPPSPRRFSDDLPASSSSQTRRSNRYQHRRNLSQDDNLDRWNPRSEHLQRKTFRMRGRTGSLDELEEFATSYRQKETRGAEPRDQHTRVYEMEDFDRYPSYRDGPPQRYHHDEEDDDRGRHDDRRKERENNRRRSPPPSPKKRRGTWKNDDVPAPPPLRQSPASSSSQGKDYDDTFLSSLLDRKARLKGVANQGKNGRAADDSDTPSKASSKKSSSDSSRHRSRSPSNQPELQEAEGTLPAYSEKERERERIRAAES
ncbi:immunoglobulin-like domain-containing receptor 2, partial [Aplochiton taeniatus]